MGDNKVADYVGAMLPDTIQEATIGDLLTQGKTKIKVTNSTFTAQRKIDDRVLTLKIEKRDGFEMGTQTQFDAGMSKKEQKKIVRSLLADGYTQEEVADMTGKSQSTVSRWASKM